jgi:hypothetical protein
MLSIATKVLAGRTLNFCIFFAKGEYHEEHNEGFWTCVVGDLRPADDQ